MHNAFESDSDFHASEILRSINVLHDIDSPERIGHYHPTTKSLNLIRSLVINSKSVNNIVVAPYGSGKSLLATFIGQLLENKKESAKTLKKILKRLEGIDSKLHAQLVKRIDKKENSSVRSSGLVIPLAGYQANLGQALCRGLADALERLHFKSRLINDFRQFEGSLGFALENISNSKKKLNKETSKSGVHIERILILWDEFGVHLEQLISRGDANRLNEVQLLAEFTVRQKTIPFSFATFLHQSLINYSSGSSQSIKNEWKKIEGRFETIQYVDDSFEIIRLIGKIVESFRDELPDITENLEKQALKSIEGMGLFKQLSKEAQRKLVHSTYPLEPATLYSLPRVSARAAQNERTLFAFLHTVNLSKPVSPSNVFDYFEETMRADSGAGGSFHQWHEIQNAIEMSSNKMEIEIIKITGILGLGVSGQRARVSKTFLEHAAAGYRNKTPRVKRLIKKLVDEKTLLHRKNTDHVTIWHGVDIDLQGRLEEQKAKYEHSFNLLKFLHKKLPARPWLPLEYNARKKMKRYFLSRYIAYSELNVAIESTIKDLKQGMDGAILHIIPDNSEEIDANIVQLLDGISLDRILLSIPNRSIPIYDRALEVYTLQIMQEDHALLGEDPLVLPELRIMTDDAITDLNQALKLLTYPYEDGPSWYTDGKVKTVSSAKMLRTHLSEIYFKHYSATPVLNNELIICKKPRATIVNARKKLISGILEDIGCETLGLDGFRPDTSMLRTLLINTGLYRKDYKNWNFVEPQLVEDENLRAVWQRFQKLLQQTSNRPKDLETFFQEIKNPPFGLREGVYPIFLSAALMTFGKNITLSHNSKYIGDITPNIIESLCKTPNEFNLYVHEISDRTIRYMESLVTIFDNNDTQQEKNDIIRRVYDAIRNWLTTLAPATSKTKKLSENAIKLIRELQWLEEPMKVFIEVIPGLFSSRNDEICNMDKLNKCICEIESVIKIYYQCAEDTIREALKLKRTSHLPQDIKQWTSLIPQGLVQEIDDIQAVALFNRLIMSYDSTPLFIDSVASLLTDETVNRWDDSSIVKFDRIFRSAIARIEEHVIHRAKDHDFENRELTELVSKRFEYLFESLAEILGKNKARKKLERILEEIN